MTGTSQRIACPSSMAICACNRLEWTQDPSPVRSRCTRAIRIPIVEYSAVSMSVVPIGVRVGGPSASPAMHVKVVRQ